MSVGSVALGLIALASWLSAGLLVSKARERPRIGALTVWAASALVLSIFGTVCLALMVNRQLGLPWFGEETARLLFAVSVLVILLISPAWLVLYFADRLGSGRDD